MVGSPDAIRALVEPPLLSSGVELWDVEVSSHTVRLLVDRPGGVDLDALAAVAAKVVSPLLDEHPDVAPEGHYDLEVSSPGVERTLRRPEHYAGYVGRPVSVKTSVAVGGARRHQGILRRADDSAGEGAGIEIEPDDGPAGAVLAIRYSDIDRARTVLMWGPAEKPGKKARAPKGAARSRTGSSKPLAGDQAVKRSAADGRDPAAQPVASRQKDAE